jgi:hypothetical protein
VSEPDVASTSAVVVAPEADVVVPKPDIVVLAPVSDIVDIASTTTIAVVPVDVVVPKPVIVVPLTDLVVPTPVNDIVDIASATTIAVVPVDVVVPKPDIVPTPVNDIVDIASTTTIAVVPADVVVPKPASDIANAFVDSFGDDDKLITEIRVVDKMTRNQSKLVKTLEGITELRTSDGYVNATKMCNSAGKLWADFARLDGTKAFLVELSKALGYSIGDLIENKNGSQDGTWVHPRIAIKLATWCSPKFEVEVTDLVLRYMQGDVTTDESRACAAELGTAIVGPSNRALVAKQTRSKLRGNDEVIAIADIGTAISVTDMGIPDEFLPPNCVYVIIIGVLNAMFICKWGLASSAKHRIQDDHRAKYPGCKTVFIASFGSYSVRSPEDTMKYFCKSNDLYVRVEDETECFAVPVQEANEWFSKIKDTVVQQHGDKINHLCIKGVDQSTPIRPEQMNPRATMPAWVSDAIEVEKERTKQVLERTKQLELEARKAELEARKSETELEILRLKIAHNILT